MNVPKIIISVGLIILVVGGIIYLNSQKAPRDTVGGNVEVKTVMGTEEKAKLYPTAKEITTPDGFINTTSTSSGQATPITIGEFVGKKVVLLDIWTYSCINCQRTTPYLNAWYEKYKDKGLVIIGLHTPEFEFEKVYQNVLEATERMGIKYPVVLDNDFSTWNAYQNRFWPRKYLIDIDGYVVYDHIGEGAYLETEMKIRELLLERTQVLGDTTVGISDSLAVSDVPQTTIAARSPEAYFGSLRNEYLANGTPGRQGEQKFSLPRTFMRDALYLGGAWVINPEFAEAVSDASIVYKYNAKEVYIVADADMPIEVEVLQDGKPVGTTAGADVNVSGIVTMKESRLYKLIRNMESGEHTLELKVRGTGVRFYAFTFG